MNKIQLLAFSLLVSCAFVALNVSSFLEERPQQSVLQSNDLEISSNQVTVLNDKLSKNGVNTGDSWKTDETVPVGSLNPSIPIFQSGVSPNVNISKTPTARPNEDKGEDYGNVLQRSGVNTGESNSQWNRKFSNTGGLEPSYSAGSTPNREKESFSGMVDDVFSGKEGGTVRKAMQKFNSALDQFVQAEGTSLSASPVSRRPHTKASTSARSAKVGHGPTCHASGISSLALPA